MDTRTLPAKSRELFILKSSLVLCLLVLAAIAAPMRSLAQSAGINAGGNWMEYDSQDTMTAAHRAKFVLRADGARTPEPFQARIEIFCENGAYKAADFAPGIRMAPPNRPGFWGQPQMEVMVRVDESHSNHGWNWTPNSLSMDKGTTRELIGAQIFKVQYLAPNGPSIAEFSPAGLDRARVSKACGLTPKKP